MISIIIVNYNSLDYLKKCLQSIRKTPELHDYEIIVVNNDPSPLKIDISEIPLRLIEINRNIGFGPACNIGAKSALGDILCFLNPDTQIISLATDTLTEIFNSNPFLGIIGPRILAGNDTDQPWSFGEEISLGNILKNNLIGEKKFDKKLNFETDWVSGAALFIRKEVLDTLGGFDPDFFMYFEDIDLCKRARLKSYKIFVSDKIVIRHRGGASFNGDSLQKNHYYKSQDLYFKKYGGFITPYLLRFLRLFH